MAAASGSCSPGVRPAPHRGPPLHPCEAHTRGGRSLQRPAPPPRPSILGWLSPESQQTSVVLGLPGGHALPGKEMRFYCSSRRTPGAFPCSLTSPGRIFVVKGTRAPCPGLESGRWRPRGACWTRGDLGGEGSGHGRGVSAVGSKLWTPQATRVPRGAGVVGLTVAAGRGRPPRSRPPPTVPGPPGALLSSRPHRPPGLQPVGGALLSPLLPRGLSGAPGRPHLARQRPALVPGQDVLPVGLWPRGGDPAVPVGPGGDGAQLPWVTQLPGAPGPGQVCGR